MFTDASWSADDVEVHASIIGVPTSALISSSQLTGASRSVLLMRPLADRKEDTDRVVVDEG